MLALPGKISWEGTKDNNCFVHKATREAYQKHREESHAEFLVYKTLQRIARSNTSTRHSVCDFAEKVLLPRLLRHPGQLHFTTGFQFYTNAVSSSKTGQACVFGWPEGH